jgi:hypothetical protein
MAEDSVVLSREVSSRVQLRGNGSMGKKTKGKENMEEDKTV